MRLSTFILDNLEPILKQWEDFARSLQPGRLMTVGGLRDDAERMLRFIAADIETSQSRAEQLQKSVGLGPLLADGGDSAAHDHGKARAVDHFTFSEMVSEYRALRAAVTRMWLDSAGIDRESVDQLVRFDEAIDQVLAESVVRFAATLERESDLFTASIGHDLRNPLNSIVSSSEMLAQSRLLPEAERAAAKRIAGSAFRMAGMLAELQDFSRSRLHGLIQLSLEHANLAQICREVIAEIAATHPTYALKFTESGDTAAVVDRKRIGQLISNLVGNAVQHGTPSGEISVSVLGEEQHVRMEVHNEGPKIDQARLEEIFEPLQRAESELPRVPGSLGLGLYIVRRIAVAHGGAVSVTSTEAAGTTFVVLIPRTPQD
ncbi:MAG TPA: HAMP domain-containing sensor histidine kinase [Aromatoleum sp.]|uniref:sensor histidine kinase n=1 Tax=Aromatoleum sp. TaxID=2307007 RepID=UPI002B46210F|nr:HAMP domain-containing sensor histidine kinase [Aromatoleum sp.]HJV25166.1 HAMP domain-containing sensor histidine kinase [Aromatoleum sp.]